MKQVKTFLFLLMIPLLSFADSGLDVFVIGDSQIGYNHHYGFEMFFQNPKELCGEEFPVDEFSYAGYGASGSGFHHWTERVVDPEQQTKHGQICNMHDHKRWFGSDLDGTVSIDNEYSNDPVWGGVCLAGESPLDKVLSFQPKIIVASFLGAHSSKTENEIREAVVSFEESIPDGTSCIVVTSPPILNYFEALTDEEIDDPVRQEMFLAEAEENLKWGRLYLEDLKEKLIESGVNPDEDEEYQEELKFFKLDREMEVKTFREELERIFSWNDGRIRAAEAIHKVVLENKRCHLVRGIDEAILNGLSHDIKNYVDYQDLERFRDYETIHFDSFHLTQSGSEAFFEQKKEEICRAFKNVNLGLKP